jgi:hypothetical protein
MFEGDRFGVNTRFLATSRYDVPPIKNADSRLFSPSAFYYGAIQSQYDFDMLYRNDISDYVNKVLAIGLIQ